MDDMTIAQARALAAALTAAADAAQARGDTTVTLVDELRAVDDAARAELQAAIDAAAP